MSITPANNVPISVDYTSRDYYSLREDLIARIQSRITLDNGVPSWTASDPTDFGVALVEAFAYMGDLLSYYIDRASNESHIATSVNRKNVLNHAKFYGYIPSGWRSADASLYVHNSSGASFTLKAGSVVTGQSQYKDSVITVYFTTLADLTVANSAGNTVSVTEGIPVTVLEGTDQYGVQLGVSNGLASMEFTLPNSPVVDNSLYVYVQTGGLTLKWSQVTHLIDYGPSDLVYALDLDENDNSVVRFGDGVSGAIPPNSAVIKATYTVGGGEKGNVAAGVLKTVYYTPDDAVTTGISVANLAEAAGGEDPESTEEIRALAPMSLRALNRAVTLKDYEDLATFVSGVGKAKATGTSWTNVTMYIAPSRSASSTDVSPGITYSTGLPNSEFTEIQTRVKSYLANKTLLGASLTVSPPTYVDLKLNVEYILRDQYSQTDVTAAIIDTLSREFNYFRMPFNDTLYPQDIEYVLQKATGVKLARVTVLSRLASVSGTISAITATSGTATVTLTGHGLVVGQGVVISGVTDVTGYNGYWVITAKTTDTFSFVTSTTGTSTGTSGKVKSYTNSAAAATGSAGEILRLLMDNVAITQVSV